MNPQFAAQFQQRHPDENVEYAGNSFSKRLYLEMTRTSLPGLLHYEDRNSMAHSIEARVPFLDYRLIEYAFSLPDDQKIKNGYTKAILRNSMKGILPENIRTRTDKMGFVTPERAWLSTDLKSWLDDILNSSSFKGREYFEPSQIRNLIEQHRSQQRDLGFTIWRWVNLELWMTRMIDPSEFNVH